MKKHYITSIRLRDDIKFDTQIYPFNLSVIGNLKEIFFHENVTFFTWENGSWKSTLLEAIAVQYGFNPEWGSKNFNFSSNNTHSELEKYIRISKGIHLPKDWYFLRAESYYNVASHIDDLDKEESFWAPIINSYGWISLHEQSHWESFFSLFMERLWWNWIYILDEPEAALSPQRQLALLVRMNELINNNSQFIIATHSPILLSYPNAKIIEIDEFWYTEPTFKDTQNYSTYKSFMENPERMIQKLWITQKS